MESGLESRSPLFFLTVVLAAGMVALAWFLSRAKRVWIEDDELIVGEFTEETRYPLKDIYKVTATRFWNPEQVRVFFNSPSKEQKSIFFYPPIRWFRFWSQHPVAEEIRQLAHAATSPDTPYVEVKLSTEWKRVIFGLSAIILFAFLIISFAVSMMKDSEPFQWSLAQARTNASVVSQLGSPIEPGWLVKGSFRFSRNKGSASLKYPVSGPNGKGEVVVEGIMRNRVWRYSRGGVWIGGKYVSFIADEDRT